MFVHRFWSGPARPLWIRRAVESVLGVSTVNEWTPANLPDPIGELCGWGLPVRDLSNRVRYRLLLEYGGLWVDHDVIPVRPFPGGVWTAVLGELREGAVLSFPEPQHPMMAELVDRTSGRKPMVSGMRLLNLVDDTGVGREPRVLPHNAHGTWTGVRDALAVHMWESSRPARDS